VLWTGELCEAPPEAGDVDGALQSHGWGQRAPVSLADLDYRG
jgi:hypothetical protein